MSIILYLLTIYTDNAGNQYSDDKTILTKVKSSIINIEIDKNVKEIQAGAFSGCNQIEKVTFAEGSELEALGDKLFYKSTIKTANFSNCESLLSISEACFKESSLKTIILPPNIKYIYSGAFDNSKITSIKFPDSLERISSWKENIGCALGYCYNLETVEIGVQSNLYQIGSSAFYSCTNLKEFYIPSQLKELSYGVFCKCSKLNCKCDPDHQYFSTDGIGQSIFNKDKTILYQISSSNQFGDTYTVPETVVRIRSQAFRNVPVSNVIFTNQSIVLEDQAFFDTDVTNVSYPTELSTVVQGCFQQSRIQYVYLSSNVTIIQSQAFYNCPDLIEVFMSKGLELINKSAFALSINVNLTIPQSVMYIEAGAFTNIPNSNIHFLNSTKFQLKDNILYCDNSIIDYFGEDVNKEITIPTTCRIIAKSMFKDKELKKVTFDVNSKLEIIEESAFQSSTLQEIILPPSLIEIQKSAFESCLNLTTVYLAGQFSNIPSRCFYGCTSLNNLTIDDAKNITVICEEAFKLCSKLEIDLLELELLDEIRQYAFSGAKMKEETFIPSSISNIGTYAFSNTSIKTLNFHTEKSNSSDGLQNLRQVLDDQIEDNISIPNYCFYNCKSLTTINIGDDVSIIGKYSFSGCTGFSIFNLSINIQYIYSYAFSDCIDLTSVFIPQGSQLKQILGYAFHNTNLIKFDIEDGAGFDFDNGALMNDGKTNLIHYIASSPATSFIVPSTISNIEAYAFLGANNLWEVIFLEGNLSSIGYQAFANCTSLHRLMLPNSLNNIAEEAFLNCNNIKCGGLTLSNTTLTDIARDAGIPDIALSTGCLNNIKKLFDKGTCYQSYTARPSIYLFAVLLSSKH